MIVQWERYNTSVLKSSVPEALRIVDLCFLIFLKDANCSEPTSLGVEKINNGVANGLTKGLPSGVNTEEVEASEGFPRVDGTHTYVFQETAL